MADLTGGDHARHECPDSMDDSPHVHAEDPLPVGDGALPEHAGLKDSRVVAQQVHGAEGVVRPSGQCLDRGAVAHIGEDADHRRPGHRRAARRRDRLLECVGFDISCDDAHAGLRAPLNETAADAAGGTRHDSHLVGKFGEHATSRTFT